MRCCTCASASRPSTTSLRKHEEEKMKRKCILRGLKFVLFAALAAFVFSFVVMSLWNWLTPTLFGWHAISFWQALGLLVLSKILFGGFRGRPGPHLFWRPRRV